MTAAGLSIANANSLSEMMPEICMMPSELHAGGEHSVIDIPSLAVVINVLGLQTSQHG